VPDFKVMDWLRKVRDDRVAREAGLTAEEEILRTRERAREFRASRAARKAPGKG
jgi:hypothetical protein